MKNVLKMDNVIPIKKLFGKEITDIYAIYGIEEAWLDTAICYVELDNHLIIDIPFCSDTDVRIKEFDSKAKTIFVSDKTKHPIDKIIKWVFRQPKTEKPELIRNNKIVDFIWYDEKSLDKGFLLLSNGCLISETTMFPSGAGIARINLYESIERLIEIHGKDYKKTSK